MTVNGTASAWGGTYNAVDFSAMCGKTLTLTVNGATNAQVYIEFPDKSNTIITNTSKSFVVPEDVSAVTLGVMVSSGMTADNETIYVQLELGSQATPYEPPHVTTAPVDLSGHQLRSLPDGTRDVLSVDGSGACKIEQQVGAVTFDGNTPFIFRGGVGENNRFIYQDPSVAEAIGPVEDLDRMMCDTMPVLGSVVDEIGVCFDSSGGKIQIIRPESTVKELQSWMESNPTTVIFERRKSQAPDTFAIDTITPPVIYASDATLWAASNVTTDIEASLWEPFAEEGGMQQKALIEVAKAAAQAGLITVKETVMRWSSAEYPLYIFNMKALNKAIYVGVATKDSFGNNMYTSPDIPYYADITPLSGIITGAVQVPSKSDTGNYHYPAISGYIETRHTQQGYAGYSSVNGYAWNDTTIQKGWCMIFGECEPTD